MNINLNENILKNWMSKIDDSKYISEITIPGTHDSGALYEPFFGTIKCQDKSIMEQLNIGVRYLDIRCRHINDIFKIYHGSINQNLNFQQVIDICIKFLNENKSEVIIMSVKEEYIPKGNERKFSEIFIDYINKNTKIWYTENNIPKLKDIRGKICIIRRFICDEEEIGICATKWSDNSSFIISENKSVINQNEYKNGVVKKTKSNQEIGEFEVKERENKEFQSEKPININGKKQNYHIKDTKLVVQDCYKVLRNESKLDLIIQLYENTLQYNKEYLCINYTSGYRLKLGIPSIRTVSTYINKGVLEYLINTKKKNVGISVMDFMDENLSKAIISINF